MGNQNKTVEKEIELTRQQASDIISAANNIAIFEGDHIPMWLPGFKAKINRIINEFIGDSEKFGRSLDKFKPEAEARANQRIQETKRLLNESGVDYSDDWISPNGYFTKNAELSETTKNINAKVNKIINECFKDVKEAEEKATEDYIDYMEFKGKVKIPVIKNSTKEEIKISFLSEKTMLPNGADILTHFGYLIEE